jgi:alpha-tubulin suppressor-like RCC1 family protein
MQISRAGRRTVRRLWIASVTSLGALALAPAAVHAEGAAVAWGENIHGALGVLFRDTREESPVGVEGLSNIVQVAAGKGFSLALLGDGTVASWGGNKAGQLGDGVKGIANWETGRSHVAVVGLGGVVAVAAANSHALALLGDGTVAAWGNNEYGQMGNGLGGFESRTGENQTLPKTVAGLQNVIAIAAGGGSDYAVLANHTVMAWGNDDRGQLGVRPSGPAAEYTCETEGGREACVKRPSPVVMADGQPLGHVVAVAAGQEAAYALLEDGHVMAWGANDKGQLGDGGETAHSKDVAPGEVMVAPGQPLHGVAAIAAGFNHALALDGTGAVWGWGDNEKGGLGARGPERCGNTPCDALATPIKALEGMRVSAIAAGVQYSLALSQGSVYALGNGAQGELGNGSSSSQRIASPVGGIGPVSAIAAGSTHVLALLGGGVAAPAPLMSGQGLAGSLSVSWTFPGAERELYHRFEAAPQEGEEETTREGREDPSEGGEAEGGREKSESVKLTGSTAGVLIDELHEQPLEVTPYEVKIRAAQKNRTIILTPLSAGSQESLGADVPAGKLPRARAPKRRR